MSSGGCVLSELRGILKGHRVCIMPHRDADPDALASALLIQALLRHWKIKSRIYSPSINRFGRSIERFIENTNNPPERDEIIVCVDASAPSMLPVKVNEKKIVVIDHHRDLGDWDGVLMKIVRYTPSNTEFIWSLFRECRLRPKTFISRDVALASLVGIHYDTGSFRFSTPETLRIFAKIMETYNIGMDEFVMFTSVKWNNSERIAVLKAMQRLKYREYRGWYIGISRVSAYESTAARRLVDSGLDVVFVGSEDKKHSIRIASRASEYALSAGLDLTVIIDRVKENMKLDGGGHPGAAGMTGDGDIEAILNALVEETMHEIDKIAAADKEHQRGS